ESHLSYSRGAHCGDSGPGRRAGKNRAHIPDRGNRPQRRSDCRSRQAALRSPQTASQPIKPPSINSILLLYNAWLMLKLIAALPRLLVSGLLLLSSVLPCLSQQIDPNLYSGLRWRMIGPFRGGRSNAVSGVPGQPNVYYFGAVGGGVWK